MKILFIGPAIGEGTGGEVIRKRNLLFLTEYAGKENIHRFVFPIFAFYPFTLKDYGGLRNALRIMKRRLHLLLNLRKEMRSFLPDLIYFDNSLVRFPLPRHIHKSKTVVFFHNIEQNYARQSGDYDSAERKSFLRAIVRTERGICRSADVCICINRRDSEQMRELYSREADYILPISFADSYRPCSERPIPEKYMLFVGANFFGNTDGLFRFIENCLDAVNMKLVVIGSGMDEYKDKYPDKNVLFLGYVKDLAPWYCSAACVVLPIVSGSGMKTKTCEALMYGKKIVGTKEAFEGYEHLSEADCIQCCSDEETVTALRDIAESEEVLFSQRSRDYYLKYYSSDVVKKDYFSFLAHLEESWRVK